MIKCNRCGKMTPAGTVCQACGAPLTGMVNNGPAQSMGFQDQPELPAWLESLRAGERPAAPPANNVPNFSPADLVDDGALPSWMRSERGDARDNMSSNSPASAQPNQFPDQGVPGGNVPPQGITAQSLIDEKSLPSWMQEGASSGTSPQPSPNGLAASSLVQPDNVPDWMRTLQSSSAAPRPNPAPAAPQPPARPAEPPASSTVAPGFSARDLVDQQSLPSWMQPQNEPVGRETNAGASAINQTPQPPMRPAEPPASPTVTPGFSARDLVDQQSLPSWMQPQNEPAGRETNAGANSNASAINQTPPAASGGQNGFSASSLLDVDSLPSWLREGAQGSGQQPRANNPVVPTPQQPAWPAQAPAQPDWNQGQSGSVWPIAGGQTPSGMQAPMQTPPANSMPQQGGQLSAASFIDPNSLPEWLRSSGGQPGTAGQPQGPGSRPSGYGVPPRPDNMRVPSRPRNEVNPSESSELAANVFASMLGVASATPNYPVQQQGGQPGQSQPQAYGQNPSGVQPPYTGQAQTGQGAPYSQPGQAGSYAPSGQSGQWNQPGAMGQPGMSQNSLSGMPASGSIPNTPTGTSGVFPQNYSAGNSLSGTYGNAYPGSSQGQGNPGMGANPSMGGQTGVNAGSPYAGNAYGSQASSASPDSTSDQKSNKKRGLFEAIREWLSR
ncbi:hypothetical protein [Dictyobacter aurantiacus]|nr:hypothetical protein [Dictyobacter aurantiacus]